MSSITFLFFALETLRELVHYAPVFFCAFPYLYALHHENEWKTLKVKKLKKLKLKK